MGTSYIPFPPWALVFCFVPLWLDLSFETSLKRVFWKAWVAQFTLTLIGFHWVAYVAHEFGYLPWPVAILLLLGFCAAVHLYIPLALVFAKVVVNFLNRTVQEPQTSAPASTSESTSALPATSSFSQPARQVGVGLFFILAACFHSLGEILWPAIFPWNLGYPLLDSGLWIAQHMDVIGALGLSFVVLLLNATLCRVALTKDRGTWAITIVSLIVFGGFFSYWGKMRGERWSGGDKTLNVLQVQANIGNLEKIQAEKGAGFQREISDRYFRLTREALANHANIDLIIWPESAYPDFLGNHNQNRFYASQFRRFVEEVKLPIITGSYANDPPDFPVRNDYNGMFLYQPDGTALSPEYHKTYLLAFGEYVPLGEMFPILKKLNPGGPGFGRGSGATIFDYQGVDVALPTEAGTTPADHVATKFRIGPQICYEGLYPEFSEAQVKKGAQILVNLTNDSWFGQGFEPRQHMMMTLARGVESRRPLLRSTNTGITTAMLADGTMLQRSPLFEEWSGVFQIPYRENPALTFYTRYGSWLPFVVGALAAFSLLLTLLLAPKKIKDS